MPFDSSIYEIALKMPVIAQGTPNDLFGDQSVLLYTYEMAFSPNYNFT